MNKFTLIIALLAFLLVLSNPFEPQSNLVLAQNSSGSSRSATGTQTGSASATGSQSGSATGSQTGSATGSASGNSTSTGASTSTTPTTFPVATPPTTGALAGTAIAPNPNQSGGTVASGPNDGYIVSAGEVLRSMGGIVVGSIFAVGAGVWLLL
ncbi:hypothetical protein IE53DRAFT_259636 [Violaceomyces palustris]|uniref:Uncharacterized protein n=1 Tax=Violaceomyces palustris TaxID=1673888 RepID=A0ACD0NNA8_9BASI|nr:hypothetical protein IE53DRAFT_259636 [Violaceomyces palustris]